MTDRDRFRALTLGPACEHGLCPTGLRAGHRRRARPGRQPSQPSPSAASRRQAAEDGRQRDHRHRDQARRKSAGRSDQRPGDRHQAARPAQHFELRGLYQAAAVGQLPDRRAGRRPSSTCAASRPAATATTRARCPRSAPISTSSRSRPSAERSTSTSTTSPGSRASPGRRARCTARRARPARSASSPTSPSWA